METQKNEFTEMACKRYQRAWRGYEAIVRSGGSGTLFSYCESVHVNYNGMKQWVAARRLSVRHLRRRNGRTNIEKNPAGESPSMFVQFIAPAPAARTSYLMNLRAIRALSSPTA